MNAAVLLAAKNKIALVLNIAREPLMLIQSLDWISSKVKECVYESQPNKPQF